MATKGGSDKCIHECYHRCIEFGKHASSLTAAVTKASLSDEKVAAYLKWCCVKYAQSLDANGRSLLHVAASMGRLRLLMFLLNHQKINVNGKDFESGYTPLHRSLFYGQVHCAVKLIQAGANMFQNDAEDLTALDHVMKDRPNMLSYDATQPCEVYVWGTNTSYNLGIGHNNSRANPEPLAYFRKENISIKQAFMSKFHSLFIGSDGKVWVCGVGSGGRLGLGDEATTLVPKALKIGKTTSDSCKAASVGINHTLLLLENGSIWSFGSNNYHQLGHSPPPEEILSPKPIRSLKGVHIVGIIAAKFHSVFWTKTQLYTCGLNGGQLGFLESNERTITTPKLVTSLKMKTTIEHVASSDGALVVVGSKGDIYLFRDYQCKRLKTSKSFSPTKKICILGGHLDHKVYSSSLQEKGGDDLKILILTESNCIYLWQETHQQMTLCLLSLHRYINITDLTLNRASLLLTTKDGEAFTGEIKLKKRKNQSESDKTALSPKCNDKFAGIDDCEYIKLKRIPHIHRAVSIASDLKGRNFAVVQTHPKCGVLVPYVESTDMKQNMKMLLDTASECDDIHDVVFAVGAVRYPAHRYVVSYSSAVLKEMIDNASPTNGVSFVEIENIQPQIFQRILYFIYTGECDLLETGASPSSFDPVAEVFQEIPLSSEEKTRTEEVNPEDISAFEHHNSCRSNRRRKGPKPKTKVNDPIQALRDASKLFGLDDLTKHLEALARDQDYKPRRLPRPKFCRKSLQNLWDISLKAEDGTIIKAHKCILIARLEYFNSMINHGWLESSLKAPLKLSISSSVLEILIRYLYTDEVPELIDSYDIDLSSLVLVVADELLCARLKEIAEASLANMITLKIAPEMLQLAVTYNAKQLKEWAMEFICLNLSSLLESRSLDILSDSLLTELTNFYRSWLPCMRKRDISTHSDDPPDVAFVDKIHETEPVSLDRVEEEPEEVKPASKGTKEKSQRKKRNSESNRIRNTSVGSITSDEELMNSSINKLSDSFGSDETWIKVINHSSKPTAKSQSQKIKVVSDEVAAASKTSPPVANVPVIPIPKSAPINVRNVVPRPHVKKDSFSDSEGEFVLLGSSSHREFPALGASVPEKATPTSPKSPSESNKKFVRISQKQRKKLASQSTSQDEAATPKSGEEFKQAWGLTSRLETQTMSNIMKNETRTPKQSVVASSPPWQASSSPTCSLSAIMADERHQREMTVRLKSKTLEYTQMEDKAIDDLILLYDIANVTDERITIRRADTFSVSPPVWVTNNR